MKIEVKWDWDRETMFFFINEGDIFVFFKENIEVAIDRELELNL